jgi:hypothetical protein
MENMYECKRCGNPIEKRFQSIQLQPDAATWVKLGYCSIGCYRKDVKDHSVSKELKSTVSDTRKTVEEAKVALVVSFFGFFSVPLMLITPLVLIALVVTTPVVFIFRARAKKRITANPKHYKGLQTAKSAIILVVLAFLLALYIYAVYFDHT